MATDPLFRLSHIIELSSETVVLIQEVLTIDISPTPSLLRKIRFRTLTPPRLT